MRSINRLLALVLTLGMLSFLAAENVQGQDSTTLGDELFLQSDFAGAETAYDAAIATDPQNHIAYAHRCYLRLFQERWKEALADCQQAETLAPDKAEGYIYLTRAYDWNREFAAAVKAGERAVELAPENGLAHSFLGEAYIDLSKEETGEDAVRRLEDGKAAIRLGAELAPDEPETHRNLAIMYNELDDAENMLAELKIAISLAPRFTPYYRQIARYHYWLGQPEQALDYFQQMQAIAQQAGNRIEEARAINGIGGVHLGEWRQSEAREYFEKALSIYGEVGNRTAASDVTHNIGVLLKQSGQLSEALEYLKESLSIYREIGDRGGEQAALWNTGVVCRYMGEYREALKYHKEALAVRRELHMEGAEQASLINIGAIYDNLGQHEEAVSYYQEALEIDVPAGKKVAFNNLGGDYYGKGDLAKAMEYYEQSLAIGRDARTLGHIGKVHTALGQYDEALDYLEEALTLAEARPDLTEDMTILSLIGRVYRKQGQYEQALSYYERVLALAQGLELPFQEAATLNSIGRTYYELGDKEKTLEYYLQALALYEQIRGGVVVQELKTSFAETYQSLYERTVSLFMELGRSQDAFHYSERARVRTLLDQLGNIHLNPHETDTPELFDQVKDLREDISELEVTWQAEYLKTGSERSVDKISHLSGQLEEKRQEYAELLETLELNNPEYASLLTVNPPTLEEIQRLLPNITLVEYFVTGEQTFAFVISANDFQVETIEIRREELQKAVESFRYLARKRMEIPDETRSLLYDTLFAPVRSHIKTDLLLIAPHNQLHYVPFQALHNGRRYLVEEYTIAYVPSAGVLPFIQEKPKSNDTILALGNPTTIKGELSFAREEVEAIAGLYGAQALVGGNATESAVWSRAGEAGILHLAAHSEYERDNPLFSAIHLAPDDQNDGRLEVHEIYSRLDLTGGTDLVVLSACETQVGELSAGDEVAALNRAFLYAGTPSVVASLWAVDDESTMLLMQQFYTYLRDGMSKAEALRQAQIYIQTMDQGAYSLPYYWAAFVLTGDIG